MPGAVANPKKGGKGPHEQEDAFIRAIDRIVTWVRSNTVSVVVGAVVLGLLVAGGLWWRGYQQNLEERATQRLTTLRSEITAGQHPDPAAALRTFLDRFGDTPTAREARIVLARQLLQTDRPSEAAETIRPTVEASTADTPTGYAARQILAQALEASGQTEQALEIMERLEQRARFGFQRRSAAAERARIYRETGRLEEALAIYERLADEVEQAQAASLYAVRAGEIRGLLVGEDSGTGSAGTAPSPDEGPTGG